MDSDSINHDIILLTKTNVVQNEDALSYHRVRGLYHLAVVFVVTITHQSSFRSGEDGDVMGRDSAALLHVQTVDFREYCDAGMTALVTSLPACEYSGDCW